MYRLKSYPRIIICEFEVVYEFIRILYFSSLHTLYDGMSLIRRLCKIIDEIHPSTASLAYNSIVAYLGNHPLMRATFLHFRILPDWQFDNQRLPGLWYDTTQPRNRFVCTGLPGLPPALTGSFLFSTQAHANDTIYPNHPCYG